MSPLVLALLSLLVGWSLIVAAAALAAGLPLALLLTGVPFVIFAGVFFVRLIRGR